ncbi:MAG: hypothetical protein Q7L19_07230 [Pseudohongiella sp.]|nr:hypothetical protein [Pseudohongiella sp.]
MSCPHVAESIADHFDEFLSPATQQKHQQHLADCRECRSEIDALNALPKMLGAWQTQSVPDWDRRAIMRPHAVRKTLPHRHSHWSSVARWVPLAASLVLAIAVVTQTRVEVTDSGWSLSFGGSAQDSGNEQLDSYLAIYAAAQQSDTREWVENALRAHGETTADSVYQWMTWMEQQREQDVRRMEAGFQQMLDRDFQTVDTVRQLASYVMYQESP